MNAYISILTLDLKYMKILEISLKVLKLSHRIPGAWVGMQVIIIVIHYFVKFRLSFSERTPPDKVRKIILFGDFSHIASVKERIFLHVSELALGHY